MHPVAQYLASIYDLSTECQTRIGEMIRLRKLAKREYLLKPGQVCDHIYFIGRGLMRCYYLKGEREVTAWLRREQSVIVSIDSYYDGVPANEFIQAVEDSELFYISRREEESLYDEFPEFNGVGRLLTRRELRDHAQELRSIKMLSGMERYAFLLAKDPDLVRRVPVMYLASYLDMHPESLSRIRSQLSK